MQNRLALLLALVVALGAAGVQAQTMTQTAETQATLTPAEALQMLKDGNERFVDGERLDRDYTMQVDETASGQYPYGVVLSCIDSRVPPELVFDVGLGDIFAPRIAGNYVDADILGSMEFATAVAGSKVIVVLGHTECGAVKGACDHVEMGNLTHTLSNIAPAVYAVNDVEGERASSNKAFVNEVAHTNVRMTVTNILERSPVMAELVENGELLVVGAMYDVASGEVTFLDDTLMSSN
ncbi:MAG: carbonic anhydrase family protein [Rubricoccaceae bacterium]|nr:carbonic anhydrase family protein [Rubricoccaceae bacterium]